MPLQSTTENRRAKGNTPSSRPPPRGRPAPQNRGGRQAECWNQGEKSRIDIYTAVDSWRSYSNDPNTLLSNNSTQAHSNTDFDTFSQVFQSQSSSSASPSQAQYQSQYYQLNSWYPLQLQQTQNSLPQAAHYGHQGCSRGRPSAQPSTQWTQYVQEQSNATSSHFRSYGPMRSVAGSSLYHPYRVNSNYRFSNGVQERQQYLSASLGDGPQATFNHRVPFRPTRGIDRPRGYASSPDRPMQSVEQDQRTPNPPPKYYESPRRICGRQETPRRREVGTASPPPAPCATQAYLNQAHLEPEWLDGPQRLLVILDLNGTLMLKPDFRRPDQIHIRPGAPKLLEYLFENHTVMVYTSAQPHNAKMVARRLFSIKEYDMLAGIWARDRLGLTPAQYKDKVQVYKKLDKIWANSEIQSSYFPPGQGKWDQTNTILVDDSHLKALQEPHNLLQVPEFTNQANGMKKKTYSRREEQICQSLIVKLEALKWQHDVSRLIWRWQVGKAEIPKVPGSNVFVDEKVDQKEQARKDLEAAMNLPTPQSPVTSDDESESEGGTSLPASNLEALVVPPAEPKRSESPISEDTFKDLLSGGNAKDNMPTPTSQDG